MRKQTKQWTMRDGRKIRVCDMDDKHLCNAIRLIRRVSAKRAYALAATALLYARDAPDGAAMAAEDAADQLLAMDSMDAAEEFDESGLYAAMMDDAERRGLEV